MNYYVLAHAEHESPVDPVAHLSRLTGGSITTLPSEPSGVVAAAEAIIQHSGMAAFTQVTGLARRPETQDDHDAVTLI